MTLNQTATAERVHIAFFGKRNAGKSSLVNAVTGQTVSIVSDVKGTTTDPVKKSMELLPLGPVVIIDTPGYDDEGALGELRVQTTRRVLAQTDIAVLVTAPQGEDAEDTELIRQFRERNIPYVVVRNKADLLEKREVLDENSIYVSSKTGENVSQLKEKIGAFVQGAENQRRVIADLLETGDTVVLVIPIDEAAPKGRIILPQQQTLRDILDAHANAVCCQPQELSDVLKNLATKPKLVVTDSQVFGKVAPLTPPDILLTSFSILFARYKGDLATLVQGAATLDRLPDNPKILISEGCTHHRQCGDIGTVKLPAWIEKHTGKKPVYTFTSGGEFPDDLAQFDLIVHCGGCMLNEKEMKHRIRKAVEANIPIVNYGLAIAHIHGILKRSLQPFPHIAEMLK